MDTTTRKPHPFWILAAALLIFLVAYGLRVHQLGAQSLWNDEGSAYAQATRSLDAIARNAAADIHPPLYYWALRVWRALTGDSEWALRALSALASTLTVALVYRIGQRLYGVPVGLMAALFVALNTFQIYYAQEARMYALLALWAAASMWALMGLTLTDSPRAQTRYAVALALLNAAGLWTQYVYPAIMVAQGLLFVLWMFGRARNRQAFMPTLVRYGAANIITIALFAVWIPTAWAQLTTWPNTGAPPLLGEQLAVIGSYLTIGISASYAPFSVPTVFVLLLGLLILGQESRGRLAWWRMLVPIVWTLTLVSGFVAMGLFRDANLKFLLPVQAAFALWMARGLWVVWHLPVRETRALVRPLPKIAAVSGAALLTVSLISVLPPLYHAPEYQRDDYRAIVAAIQADPRADKAVILNAPGQSEAFEYYARGAFTTVPLPIGMTVDADATTRAVEALLAENTRIYAVLWGTDERDPDGLVERLLDARAFEIDDRWYGSVRLVRYATERDSGTPVDSGARFGESITLHAYAVSALDVAAGDALLVRLTWGTDAPLTTRYKVFVQLLSPDGTLAAQRDAEPAGGLTPTTAWDVGQAVSDNHALLIPQALAAAEDYTLIVGLYDAENPAARLAVGDGDALTLATIRVR